MEPKDFARIILRRRRTVATAIVIVMLTALVGSMRKTPLFVAQCEVLFGVVLSDPSDPKSEAIETIGDQLDNVHFINSPVIAAEAAKHVPGVSAAEIQGKINAQLVEGTKQYFKIQIPDHVPPGARAGTICNAAANAYVKYKQDVARNFFTRALELNKASYAATLDEYDLNQTRLESGPSRSEFLNLTIEQNGLLKDLNDLRTRGRAFSNQIKSGIDGGPKLTSPSGGGSRQGANRKKDLILGLLVGLMFGIGLALLREYLDDTVRDKESTQRDLGLPVLANLPAAEGSMDGPVETTSATVEAARTLRATLASLGFPHEKTTLVITSTLAKSRATTLVSLAAAVAESGRTVLVVGADMRNGRTHEGFGIANTVGLANVVRGQIAFEKAIRPAPGLDGVYVLPCGPIVGNPGELLSSEEMAFTLRKARRWADVVLIDAPPVLAAADASILGAYSDGVVLVLAAGYTNRAQANEAKEQLVAAGARVLGAVLIGSDEPSTRGGNGNYGNDDLPPMMPFGEWSNSGGGYEDDWYGDEVLTATARTAPRQNNGARRTPAKKTAAASVKKKPAARPRAGAPKTPAKRPAATTSRRSPSPLRAPAKMSAPRRTAGLPASRAPKRAGISQKSW